MSMVIAACGRIRFDPLGGGDANGDGNASDSAPTLSCAGLAATCGPAGTSSCCGSPLVPGGTFYRSYDVSGDGMYASMAYPATVSDFRLDTYIVTVGRFRQFVNAGMGTQQSPPATSAGARMLNGMANQGGWDPTWNPSLTASAAALVSAVKCNATYQSWTDTPGANEALPMNCITWYEAFAFCVWDGGFLPTEAEFNYAAAGGNEQRAYPWSSPPASLAIDCMHANYDPDGTPATLCVSPPNGGFNRVGSESPMGDGKFGQADLGGNIWQWTLDQYSTTYPTPCNDCANLTLASKQTNRGGCFNDGPSAIRVGFRGNITNYHGFDHGVRCARAP
jgi:formylglycine-generating enzyme required for sulfatase activity